MSSTDLPPTPSRQLAAIMFTDIVGYTKMMGRDESKALELLQSSINLQKRFVEKYQGIWIKEIGDGVVVKFDTAGDAVACAVEIQTEAKKILDGALRIGIHLGDITIEKGDVFGDGVNVASRLQSIADPGGVYISSSVERSIKGQGIVETIDLGEQNLKNVEYGVHVFALKHADFPIPNANLWNNELSKRKRVFGISLLVVFSGVLLGLVYVKFNDNAQQPLVVLMDGASKTRVYDEDVYEAGATNADTISDILLDLPIRRQRETISPAWHRHEEMVEFDPDLIVVHYSGFILEDSYQPRLRLKALIDYFKEQDTKFLIYSRQHNEALRNNVDTLFGDLYQEHPDLKERIMVFGLLDYGEPRWGDPIVASQLKLKVKEVLNIQ